MRNQNTRHAYHLYVDDIAEKLPLRSSTTRVDVQGKHGKKKKQQVQQHGNVMAGMKRCLKLEGKPTALLQPH